MKKILLFILFLVTGVAAVDKSSSASGVTVKVLGQSGKITVGRANPPSKDDNAVTIQMDELKERDKDGKEVGNTGNPKHSFNSFAGQNFTFSDLKDMTYKSLDAKSFDFSAVINGGAFRVTTYIFTKKGSFKNGNETIEVSDGTFKFNIEMTNWTFCSGGNCTNNEEGMYLDLTITVKGKDSAKKGKEEDTKPKGYELGGGAEIHLSTQVEVDGENRAMPEGYPKLNQQGGKDSFVFRFPKFNNNLLYDPTIDLEPEKPPKNGASTICSLGVSFLALVAAPLLSFI